MKATAGGKAKFQSSEPRPGNDGVNGTASKAFDGLAAVGVGRLH